MSLLFQARRLDADGEAGIRRDFSQRSRIKFKGSQEGSVMFRRQLLFIVWVFYLYVIRKSKVCMLKNSFAKPCIAPTLVLEAGTGASYRITISPGRVAALPRETTRIEMFRISLKAKIATPEKKYLRTIRVKSVLGDFVLQKGESVHVFF